MELRTWLSKNRLTAKKFAEDAGCTHNHMLLVKNEKIRPSEHLAMRIELLTGGEVKAKELRKE